MCCWKAITVILCVLVASGKNDENVGVLEKIKSGFKMAGNLFSSEHAAKVANLVSSALGHTQSKNQFPSRKPVNNNNIFSRFFRLFGFDTKKIGAIAVNAIIIVAQLISNSISLTPPSQLDEYKRSKNSSPIDWMLNNSAVAEILEHTKDEKLSEEVMEYVTEKSADGESGCIQLLICKITPYIKGMQEMLKNEGKSELKGSLAFLQYFPSAEELSNKGDDCVKKHNLCSLNL